MSHLFFLPNLSLFGAGCLNDIGPQAARLGGKRYLIVTDPFLDKTGLTARVADLLRQQGLSSSLYLGVTPNPTLQQAEAAYEQYCREGCGGVISIGGGSAHDCGKAVCILANNPGPLRQYVGVDLFPLPSAPMIAVNTTAGTASEITNCFIITDTQTNTKLIFEGVNALSNVAVNDPELMLTLPPHLTAATGMDALTHAVECYVSNFSFPLTNELAKVAVRLVFQHLPTAVCQPEDLTARDGMAYAQYLAGMAFGSGGVGLVHAIAHQLGGIYNLPHGLCNAILLPYVIGFNQRACAERYAELYQVIAPAAAPADPIRGATAFRRAVETLSTRIGTRKSLQSIGVKPEDFALIAHKTLEDSCSETNPILPREQEIVDLLNAIYQEGAKQE